jgi:hypothetical protein
VGGLSFLFGAFIFAFFYLKSLNSHNLFYTPASHPQSWFGTTILILVLVSAAVQTLALQRIKAGAKSVWLAGAILALALGLAAIALQIWQLAALPFWPGSSGFASVFVGFSRFSLRRVLRDGVAGDPDHAVPGDPGDLVCRAAAHVRRGVRRPAVPGRAQRVHRDLELHGSCGVRRVDIVLPGPLRPVVRYRRQSTRGNETG